MKRGVLLGVLLLAVGAIAPAETPSWESLLSEANRAQDLGRRAEAEALYRSALDQAQRQGVAEPRLAQLLNNLAAQCYYLGKLAEAESLYQRALAAWGEERGGLRRTTSNLAALYRAQGRYAEAEPLYLRVVSELDGRAGDGAELVVVLTKLAELYRAQGDCLKAVPVAERSARIARRVFEPHDVRLADSLHQLAAVYRDLGRLDEAVTLYQRCQEVLAGSGGGDRQAAIFGNLGEIASSRRNYQDAESLSGQAVSLWERALGPDHPRVAIALNNLAQAIRFQGRYADAEALYRRSVAILEQAAGWDRSDLARCLGNQADLYHAQGRESKAVGLYERALSLMTETLGPEHPQTALLINKLAEVRRAQGHYVESAKLYRQSIPILEKALGTQDARVVESNQAYRRLLKEQSRLMLSLR